MCSPELMFASASMQAVGSVMQGQSAQRRANAQASEADYQGAVEMSNARAEAETIRRAGDRQRGSVLAGYAASGVQIGSGSALDAEQQVMEDAAHDEYMALLTGQRRQNAYSREASGLRSAGDDAARGGMVNAFSGLLNAGAGYARASGWGLNGPGFSGTQMPAPVNTLEGVFSTRRGR